MTGSGGDAACGTTAAPPQQQAHAPLPAGAAAAATPTTATATRDAVNGVNLVNLTQMYHDMLVQNPLMLWNILGVPDASSASAGSNFLLDAQKQMRHLLQAQMEIQHQQQHQHFQHQQQQQFRVERTGSPQEVAVTLGDPHAAAMLGTSSDEATAGITSAEQRRRLAVAKYKLKGRGRNFDKVCVLLLNFVRYRVVSPHKKKRSLSLSLSLCVCVCVLRH